MKRQTNSRDNLEMEGETGERNAEEFSSPHEEQRSLTTMNVMEQGSSQAPNGNGMADSTYVPVGHWRDGLGDCTKHGICHTSVWNSCCCTLLGAAQTSSRLALTYMGKPSTGFTTSATAAMGAFKQMIMIVVSYWSTRAFMLLLIAMADPNVGSEHYQEPPPVYYFFCAVDDLIFYAYIIFTVVILTNIRKHIRSKYSIPETICVGSGLEDCFCSCWCPCLVVSQMMRHTADYKSYPGRCCTDTGLPTNAPSIV